MAAGRRLLIMLLLAPVVAGACVYLAGVAAPLSRAQEGDGPRNAAPPALPRKLVAVDTGRLMVSPDPVPLEVVRVFEQLDWQRPIELTSSGDGSGRLFVAEQRGVIQVVSNRDGAAESKTFLDLRDVVSRVGNEEGLLGLAFHPRYAENGEFFVYYSRNPPESYVSRFRVSKDDPSKADRSSEEVLLKIPQPYRNHNGGSIRFGPDGFLYIALGDGGLANDPHFNGQNLGTLLGSILRIDVDRKQEGRDYAVPSDNPFVDRRGARPEIWAYGFRNPWRISFDRDTGELWTGDVGQNRFEEIDRVEKGGNYGWNVREGFHEFNPNSAGKPEDLKDPVAEYFRHLGQSVTGGMVYRGRQLATYQGHYFYADYLSGKVWAVPVSEQPHAKPRLVADTGLEIAAFGEDDRGEMYLCVFDGIYQLRPREIDEDASARFPRTLSETGLFESVAENRPAPGLLPYEVNMPFWSDYAVKDRYVALPAHSAGVDSAAAKIGFHEQESWDFPEGTVFVKTFWMHRDRVTMSDPVRLETRLLVHSPEGWAGYTYVYDDDQQDARLLEGSLLKPIDIRTSDGVITQPYYVPSRDECMACHTKAAKFVLGLNTPQMNRTMKYHGAEVQQLNWLQDLDAFSEPLPEPIEKLDAFPDWGLGNWNRGEAASPASDPGDPHGLPDADASRLARAWLEVNCAMCHRPEGIAPGKIDMRHHVPLEKMELVGRDPRQAKIYFPESRLIEPGDPLLSELVFRAGHRGPRQMPPLATNLVSERGLAALRQWIREMERDGGE